MDVGRGVWGGWGEGGMEACMAADPTVLADSRVRGRTALPLRHRTARESPVFATIILTSSGAWPWIMADTCQKP